MGLTIIRNEKMRRLVFLCHAEPCPELDSWIGSASLNKLDSFDPETSSG